MVYVCHFQFILFETFQLKLILFDQFSWFHDCSHSIPLSYLCQLDFEDIGSLQFAEDTQNYWEPSKKMLIKALVELVLLWHIMVKHKLVVLAQ